MAGIGFRLQRLFTEGNLLRNMRGSLYSLIIATGPWLISIVSIAMVSALAQHRLSGQEMLLFRCIVSYTYAFSLIVFGLVEMPLTRYLADQLFRTDHSTFRSVVIAIVAGYLVISTPIALLLHRYAPSLSFLTLISCSAFLISVLITWTCMIFLSAAKHYHQIIFSFIFGAAVTYLLSVNFGEHMGLEGYVFGYALGQVILAMTLLSSVFVEFKSHNFVTLDFLQYYRKFRLLILVGHIYYLGIWVDKFIFWLGPESQHVVDIFYTNQFYDTAMFLAYITIVPAMTIFLVHAETSFAKAYHYYFQTIENKYNLPIINATLADIIASLRRGTLHILEVQLFITSLCWYFAEDILRFLSLPSIMLPIFRYGLLGALLQVLFLVGNIVLLYFLENKRVLIHYGLFFLSNCVFSLASTYLGHRFFGAGYFLATLLTFIVTFINLNRTLARLNFSTFMQQPIYREKE